MSTTIMIGYGVFSILVFILVNRFVVKKQLKNKVQQEHSATTINSVVEHQETTKSSTIEKIEATTTEQNLDSSLTEEMREKESVQKQTKKMPVSETTQTFSTGKVLTVLLIGMFLSLLNQTLINVALPKLMTEFAVSTSTAQWLTTGFMLVNGILIPISAYLVETYTYRKLFISAMAFFTVGSIICALSGNFTLMLIGRLIQAVGAGILMPLGTNVFMVLFPPEKRGAAMGLMGVAMILAPAIGPTITGYVIQNYNWHILFYGMTVLGIVTIFLGRSWFHLDRARRFPRLDLLGIVFSSIGFGTLLYGFSEAGNKGWSSGEVVGSLVIAVIALIIFVMKELKTEEPLINLRVFQNFRFSYTVIINIIVTMALYGGMILLPLYLQNIQGYTPLQSGLLLLPGSLIMGAMGPFTGRLFDKVGIKPLAIFGLLIMTITTYQLSKLSMDTPYLHVMLLYTIRSFGMSFIMMTISTEGLNQLPLKIIPHGSAAQNTLRAVAGSVGTAILVTVMTTQTTNHLADYSNEITKTNPVVMNWVHNTAIQLSHASGMPEQKASAVAGQLLYAQASKLSFIKGINDGFLLATLLSFIALVLAVFYGGRKIKKRVSNKPNVTSSDKSVAS